MPFDYESFMTGVITGLKLGRVPKGRTPPTPHGRYILTESGSKVLTESPISIEASIYNTGEWYSSASGDIRYRVTNSSGIEVNCKLMFGYEKIQNTEATINTAYIFTDANTYPWTLIIDGISRTISLSSSSFFEYTSSGNKITGTKATGNTLYQIVKPSGTTEPTGTQNELYLICWESYYGDSSPLITEGG